MIPHEPSRAAATSALAGLAVGVTGMFLPHIMFWGEAQLQTMIDKGRTPLPIFGQEEESTAALAALGRCMADQSDNAGFGIGCSMAIILAKIFVTGVSLGTGIVGGHFWAPCKSAKNRASSPIDIIGQQSDTSPAIFLSISICGMCSLASLYRCYGFTCELARYLFQSLAVSMRCSLVHYGSYPCRHL